jgi:Mannosyl-glycoprotein endo-beta-N-acetylglucosaminidase/N-acetylmuramoyl-L-alanine amidase
MGRVFVAVSHGEIEADQNSVLDGGAAAQTASLVQDLVVQYLRSNQYDAAAVPDSLALDQSIAWINRYAQTGDVAAQLHISHAVQPALRGTSLFYIAANEQRRTQSDQVLQVLLRRAPQLLSQGVQADTLTPMGQSRFCRQLVVPALILNVGYITNPDDRQILQAQRSEVALGIAEGLALWSGTVAGSTALQPTPTYPAININLNGALVYGAGLIADGNFYVPVDLVDQLGIEILPTTPIRRLSYRNIVYIRAIDLRDYSLTIQADKDNHTLILRSMPMAYPGQLDRIMGRGTASEIQMIMFLKSHNPEQFGQFTELPKLYREEATIEGVNADIAFAQMCVETNFLRFGKQVRPEQNNFAGLGGIGDAPEGASFRDVRIGVRAQIQHLKAYASTEPLVQESVDPRFQFVRRGVAPLVDQLSGRWSADLRYGRKIQAVLRLLYESAGFL